MCQLSKCPTDPTDLPPFALIFDVEVLGPARDTAEYAAWHVEPYSAPCLVR